MVTFSDQACSLQNICSIRGFSCVPTNQEKNSIPTTGLQWDKRKQVGKPQASGSKYGMYGQRP